MNCHSFESIVSELAREQTMEASVREDALLHSAECETCALKLEDERLLAAGIRALAAEMEFVEAPARVGEQLLAAFRIHRDTAPLGHTTYRWRYWMGAAAAVLLLVVGLVAIRVRLSSGQEPRQRQIGKQIEKPESSTMVTNNGSLWVSTAPDQPRQLTVPGSRRRANGYLAVARLSKSARPGDSSTASHADALAGDSRGSSEIATEFFPVGYESALNLQDGGQLMRVELPRLALARFGLPVNVNRANQKVKADVLVGVDGRARAIRFVQ
jgi:hypothetical protein